jgi:hypothetical protein
MRRRRPALGQLVFGFLVEWPNHERIAFDRVKAEIDESRERGDVIDFHEPSG